MRRRVAVLLGTTAAAGVLSVALAPAAMAHPLGNFTRNTSVEFTVSPEHVAVTHVLDLAEVPTYQERRAMDTSGDGTVSGVEAQAWGRSRCATAAEQVLATTGAGPLAWTVGASSVTFPAGPGRTPHDQARVRVRRRRRRCDDAGRHDQHRGGAGRMARGDGRRRRRGPVCRRPDGLGEPAR